MELALQGGNLAVPRDLREGTESIITLKVQPLPDVVAGLSKGHPARWSYPLLPAPCILQRETALFAVLYRQSMAEKLWADAIGLHWSLQKASDDPIIRWFPEILDCPAAYRGLCQLWAEKGLDEYRGSKERAQMEFLAYELRAMLLHLYPALMNASPNMNSEELEKKIAWYVRNSPADALGGDPAIDGFDKFVATTPFNTEELVYDATDALLAQ